MKFLVTKISKRFFHSAFMLDRTNMTNDTTKAKTSAEIRKRVWG